MDFMEVLKKRYSCKKFDGRKIRKEQLDAILEAGRLAPTDKNLQEQKIYVVQSDEGLEKIDRITPCRYGARYCSWRSIGKTSLYIREENAIPA